MKSSVSFLIWERFLNDLKKAQESTLETIGKILAIPGESPNVEIHCDRREDEENRYRSYPLMEISGIRGEGPLTKDLISLLEKDFPLRGSNPIELAERFKQLVKDGMNIIF